RNILELLAIASCIIQASYTRIDHVLLTIGNLFHIYEFTTEPELDSMLQHAVTESLKKRWRNCKENQDVFILTTVLNPWIRHDPFNHDIINPSIIWDILLRAIHQFYGKRYDMDFVKALEDYLNRRGKYSDEEMHLDELSLLSEGEDVDIAWVWRRLYNENAPDVGANLLAALAIHLLSVIANSASCEYQFSDFGREHMKPRNKLNEQMVHKTAMLWADIRRQQITDGQAIQEHRKWKLGCDTPELQADEASVDQLNNEVNDGSILDLDPAVDFEEFIEALS
ncbi:hypothetical protein OF83DRAFT_1073074, partial [Amylostereum chailletii]